MNDQKNQASRRRTSRWLLMSLAAGLTMVGSYAVYRLALSRQIEARLAEIRRAGHPATLAELDAWYPQPPDGENAANTYMAAFALLSPEDDREELLPILGTGSLPTRDNPWSDESRQAVTALLAANTDAIQLLHKAAGIKQCRYPIQFANGMAGSFPHLSQVRRSARLLQLAAVFYAQQDRPDLMSQAIVSSLGCARSLSREPVMGSQLARLDCQRSAVETLACVLNTSTLSDPELAELAGPFTEAEDLQALSRGFIGKRAWGADAFARTHEVTDMHRTPRGYRRSTLDAWIFGGASLFDSRPFQYKVSGLLQLDQISYLALMDGYVKASLNSVPDRLPAARLLNKKVKKLSIHRAMARPWLLIMDGARIVTLDTKTIAALRTAVAALTIERFRLANGKLPDTLPADPDDPFDDQPLRYRRTATGYVVYSIGDDGKDDGGDPTKDITFTVER